MSGSPAPPPLPQDHPLPMSDTPGGYRCYCNDLVLFVLAASKEYHTWWHVFQRHLMIFSVLSSVKQSSYEMQWQPVQSNACAVEPRSFPASVPGCVPQLCPSSTSGHNQSMHHPFLFFPVLRSQSTQAVWEPQVTPVDLMYTPWDLLRHALPGNLHKTTVAHREGGRKWIRNTTPKGLVLKYQLHTGVQG